MHTTKYDLYISLFLLADRFLSSKVPECGEDIIRGLSSSLFDSRNVKKLALSFIIFFIIYIVTDYRLIINYKNFFGRVAQRESTTVTS